MRILLVTQWFDPEPTLKGLLFARELVKAGHQVQVLTGFPNYPGGKLYAGYRIRFLQKEIIDGVEVFRVPLYPSHDRSGIRRVANYLSFALASAIWGAVCVKKPDVAYVYHPPGTMGFPAAILRLVRGIPFVYDVQDLWPDTLRATGMVNNALALKLVGMSCQATYRLASRIVVLSPGFKDALVRRGISADKVDVIYNWSDEAQIQPAEKDDLLSRQLGMTGRFNIVFAGTMGTAQGLESVLDAARLLQETHPRIQFVFIGGGVNVALLKAQATELEIHNVLFLPRRPVSEIGGVLSLADVLLVHLRDDPLFWITIPSKTQAYMAAGKPILMGVRGDAATLVQEAEAGVVCEPGNAVSIAEAAAQLADMPAVALQRMGANALEFYRRELSLAAGVRRFETVFETVHKQRRSGVKYD